jgi:serine protease Do
VPSNLVNKITSELIKSGRIRRSWLGVNVQDADEALVRAYRATGKGGVIVTRITDDGPADKAKLEVGDLILSFSGQPVASVRELTRVITDTPIGKDVPVRFVRDGRARTFTVTMGELQEDADEETSILPDLPATSNDLGADLSGIDDDVRRRYGVPKDVDGVVVTSVSARGPAYGKLARGDVIIEINFERVATVTETLDKVKVARATPAEPLLIRVKRRGESGWFDQFLSIDLGK